MRPQQFQAEIEATDGTPKQVARRKYLKRLIANLRPNVMRQYGSVDGPAPVTQRPMTDEERARYAQASGRQRRPVVPVTGDTA